MNSLMKAVTTWHNKGYDVGEGREVGTMRPIEKPDPVLKNQVSFSESYDLNDYILRISKN